MEYIISIIIALVALVFLVQFEKLKLIQQKLKLIQHKNKKLKEFILPSEQNLFTDTQATNNHDFSELEIFEYVLLHILKMDNLIVGPEDFIKIRVENNGYVRTMEVSQIIGDVVKIITTISAEGSADGALVITAS